MKVQLEGLSITHIGTSLPRGERSMKEYASMFGEAAIGRIKKSTGVERVHVSDTGKCSSDYTVETACRLMGETGLVPQDFDGLVNISQTPDYPVPNTAVIIQDRLGLPQDVVLLCETACRMRESDCRRDCRRCTLALLNQK